MLHAVHWTYRPVFRSAKMVQLFWHLEADEISNQRPGSYSLPATSVYGFCRNSQIIRFSSKPAQSPVSLWIQGFLAPFVTNIHNWAAKLLKISQICKFLIVFSSFFFILSAISHKKGCRSSPFCTDSSRFRDFDISIFRGGYFISTFWPVTL